MRTGAARGHTGNFHEAGFYGSDAEFLSLIVPFVREGTAAGEPVVLGYDTRKSHLLRHALPGTDGVTFLGDARLYARPAGAIEAYRRAFEEHVSAGAGQIRIAGDVPHEGNGGRFAGWDRYESAVNVVWQDHPVWSRCLYDATTVPDVVRDVVERTHRRLVSPDGAAAASPRYEEVGEYRALPPEPDPLEGTPPDVELVDSSLKRTRATVTDVARPLLDADACDELVFGASEAVINAQLYGRPPTAVRVWTTQDRVVVRVHDRGPGPADPLTGLVPTPEGTSGAGLGLWLCSQLASVDVALVTGDDGFAVRLRAGRLPDAAEAGLDVIALPAGTAGGTPPQPGAVHAVDGDGSSLCDRVGAGELVPVDDALWWDVATDQRCPACQLLIPVDDAHGRC
ncbi:anti-sigma factor RsbA family regulatory protein [Geodermatophilus sp. SYSU D00691]